MSIFERLFGNVSSPLLDAATKDIGDMLDRASVMHDYALRGLLGNEDMTTDLDKMDDAIDEMDRDVRRRLIEHLAVEPTKDVVATLVLATMVNDAERLGDYSRGLAELIPLAGQKRTGEFAERLSALAHQLRPLFDETKEAVREDNADRARHVMGETARLKAEFLAYTRGVAASDLTADMAVVYASAARILRRTGSHLSNLASALTLPYDRIRRDDEDA